MIEAVARASSGLAHFMHIGLQQRLEPVRLARAGYALFIAGCSPKATFPGENVGAYLIETQQRDGGWSDVEETLWCLGYLDSFEGKFGAVIANGHKWLVSVQLPCGAWGKSRRDQPRIPVTALAAALAPEVVSSAGLRWLAEQWETDLDNPTQLTYKGAFFLLAHANSKASYDNNLVNRTVAYLNSEQAEDGGFGPWKGHPVGGDPWSTGVALWGLSRVRDSVPRRTIERALSWLQSKQLPNGLWPYHYLDDGAAMALIGVSSILPILREH